MDSIDQIKQDRANGINKPLSQSDHAAVNAKHPGTTLEYCCECLGPTGNAGRDEDSIYAECIANGNEVGPLCPDCYNDLIFAKIIKPDEE